jgi:hypothetical protein
LVIPRSIGPVLPALTDKREASINEEFCESQDIYEGEMFHPHLMACPRKYFQSLKEHCKKKLQDLNFK